VLNFNLKIGHSRLDLFIMALIILVHPVCLVH
jgi:hypothetical protein